MPNPDETNIPTHLFYISKSIGEIKEKQDKAFEENRKNFDDIKNSYVPRMEFEEHMKADEDHEQRIRILEESRWKVAGATGIIASVLSVIGSYLISLLH